MHARAYMCVCAEGEECMCVILCIHPYMCTCVRSVHVCVVGGGGGGTYLCARVCMCVCVCAYAASMSLLTVLFDVCIWLLCTSNMF